MNDLELRRELGNSSASIPIRSASAAGSGHSTSAISAADLMAVLMTKDVDYDFSAPEDLDKDHLIFSKGHPSPLLYTTLTAAGAIGDEEMLGHVSEPIRQPPGRVRRSAGRRR